MLHWYDTLALAMGLLSIGNALRDIAKELRLARQGDRE